jgi:hypothetical protein
MNFFVKYRPLIGILLIALAIFGCAKSKKTDPNQRIYVGYYQLSRDSEIDASQFKTKTGIKPHIVSWPADFSTPFPNGSVAAFQKMNIVPLISWEPRFWNQSQTVTLESIAKGSWDAYLKTWAIQIRKLEKPVLISFAPEFNSEQYPWGTPNNDQNGDRYVAAYRHVVALFRSEGVSNAIFVWTILPVCYPIAEWNDPFAMYPGDEYVDWIGLAAVNQSSDIHTMFSEALLKIAKSQPTKPVMITRYSYEPSDKSNKEVVEVLQTDLAPIKAILFSNPKILKINPEFFKQPLFQANMEEFVYLHL